MKVAYKNNLDSQHIIQIFSKITIKSNQSETEQIHVTKIVKEMSTMNARFLIPYNIKYQTLFSARFNKEDEDD